jgi:hypothetical protein
MLEHWLIRLGRVVPSTPTRSASSFSLTATSKAWLASAARLTSKTYRVDHKRSGGVDVSVLPQFLQKHAHIDELSSVSGAMPLPALKPSSCCAQTFVTE